MGADKNDGDCPRNGSSVSTKGAHGVGSLLENEREVTLCGSVLRRVLLSVAQRLYLVSCRLRIWGSSAGVYSREACRLGVVVFITCVGCCDRVRALRV